MNIQRDRGRKPAFTRPIENLKPAEEAPPLRLSRSRVTPLSWAWISYKFKYSNEASFNLAQTREIARLKSAVELFIFCSGGRVLNGARERIALAVVATRNFGTRNFAEHLRGLESRDTQRTRRSSLSHSPGGYLYEPGSQPCNPRPLYRWTFTTADGQC